MEATGKIIFVLEARSGVSQRTGNPWMTQSYVLEVPGQFPKKIPFTIFGEDRIKQFAIQPGEDVTIQFDIDAHEYNGKYYAEIRAYNVIRGQQQAAQSAAPASQQQQPDMFAGQGQQQAPAANPFPPADGQQEGDPDDLPF